MGAAEDGSPGKQTMERVDLMDAREELIEVLLRESREELERIDLKASILLSVCSLALAALVHAAAYLHWDPRELLVFQWFLWLGMAFGGAALVALAAAVWPRLGHGQGEITYFGHVAQFEGIEELNRALDQEVSANPSRTDHVAKRLLAMSRIIYDKYRYIRWGMGLFGVAVLLCTVAAVRALTT
ncbi:MAG TPA: Pycsar system effector family protein [Rubrobacter sp.]|nr:Pycsar system effector family protein [Rubrobacter sp.]